MSCDDPMVLPGASKLRPFSGRMNPFLGQMNPLAVPMVAMFLDRAFSLLAQHDDGYRAPFVVDRSPAAPQTRNVSDTSFCTLVKMTRDHKGVERKRNENVRQGVWQPLFRGAMIGLRH